MKILSSLIFLACLAFTAYQVFGRISAIRKSILLGRSFTPTGTVGQRFKNMVLMAFGQKRMFNKPIVGILHFLLYAGFLLINIEVLEIVIDGILGTHRIFEDLLGGFYRIVINFFEVLAFSVLVACLVFLVRRNVLKTERLQAERHRELKGWAIKDAHLILFIEIILMTAILVMNASDALLMQRQLVHYEGFVISQYLSPLFNNFSDGSLHIIERTAWWFHILGIFFFAIYVTYSKHLHIFMAFPNTFFANQNAVGQLGNMPSVTHEVKLMLGQESSAEPDAPTKFGAADVQDLSRKNLMDAYTCTECGRCTEACPANLTGKALSPRKIMMDTRDRLEELQKGPSDKTLLGGYVSDEEIWACTTCNACVEACPVQINPVDIIIQLRRYRVMEESKNPASLNAMFSNIENNAAPWKFAATNRANWAQD